MRGVGLLVLAITQLSGCLAPPRLSDNASGGSSNPSTGPSTDAGTDPSRDSNVSWSTPPCSDLTVGGQVYSMSSSPCKPYSVQLSPSRKVIRFELHPGDRRSQDPVESERNELTSRATFAPGRDLWNSFSFLLEPGDPTLDGKSNNLGQWHAGFSASPPLSINLYRNNQIHIITQNDTGMQIRKVMPIERGRWYHLVIHVRFNTQSAARLEVWLDGVKQVDLSNVVIGYAQSTGNYWKFGIYRKSQTAVQSQRFANMEAGDVDLSHRVGHPLEILY